MGLDGSTLEVADEAANAQHYGYPGASRGRSAFPQLRFAALAECGTHMLVGAKMGPFRASEHELAAQVLEHADDTMLILADRGFVGYPMWKAANQRGSKLVFRLRENQVRRSSASCPTVLISAPCMAAPRRAAMPGAELAAAKNSLCA